MRKAGDPILLWVVANGPTVEQIKGIIAPHHFLMEFPSTRPHWLSQFQGQAFVLSRVYGEYYGPVGAESVRLDRQTPESIADRLAQKHPTWSAAKLNRAVLSSSAAHSGKSELSARNQAEIAGTVEKYLKILRELASFGEVILVLTAGPDDLAPIAPSEIPAQQLRGEVLTRLKVGQMLRITGEASLP